MFAQPQNKEAEVESVLIYAVKEFAIHWTGPTSLIVYSAQLIDNSVGIYAVHTGMNKSVSRKVDETQVGLYESLIVGHSNVQDCEELGLSVNGPSSPPSLSPWGGHVGLIIGHFQVGLDLQTKDGLDIQHGIGSVRGVTIANFGKQCANKTDLVWRTDPKNEDPYHMVVFQNITAINVQRHKSLYFDIPSNNMTTLNNCGEFGCDGYKKAFVLDMDGTLTGAEQVFLPKVSSTQKWIEKHAIPIRMRLHLDISRRWRERGGIQDKSCIVYAQANAYACDERLHQRLLLIQSLDEDRMYINVGPLAFITEGVKPYYLDLISGTSTSLACLERYCPRHTGTFTTIVAHNHSFLAYFTGTTPKRLRLSIVHPSTPDYAVRVGLDYATAARIDVYTKDGYVIPMNGQWTKYGALVQNDSIPAKQAIPAILSTPAGSNYYDNQKQILYVILRGRNNVEVRVQEVLRFSFNLVSMTVDEFYSANVTDKLILFLGLSKSQLRVTQISLEPRVTRSSRTRRSLPSIHVDVEVSQPPERTLYSALKTQPPDIKKLTSQLLDSVQSGELEKVLNVVMEDLKIQEPSPLNTNADMSKLSDVASHNEGKRMTTTPIYMNAVTETQKMSLPITSDVHVRQKSVGSWTICEKSPVVISLTFLCIQMYIF
ncbi:hypothetical protein PHET_06567 [Paragonimus heterotremus]|uniref:Uncharacterized protein n=1 Tax=Paragonimus heterotremus TaxID=100268 RepID=A0A8J4SW87_9TREM|nr:hypothetical protein PHET_06567 [Paragonimus heterotremus]